MPTFVVSGRTGTLESPRGLDSTVWKVADLLTRRPVVNTALLAQELGVDSTNAHRYLNPLAEVGILVATSSGPRNRVGRSPEVLGELDTFAERAARRNQL